jgi:hypothetical protein
LVEQLIRNQQVAGSSPIAGSTFHNKTANFALLLPFDQGKGASRSSFGLSGLVRDGSAELHSSCRMTSPVTPPAHAARGTMRRPRRSTRYDAVAVKHKGPILTVRVKDRLATRNRLPSDHVLRVLSEIKGMLGDAGRKAALSEGVIEPDLGIDLLTGFRKGSVQADLAITGHTEIGTLAAVQILGKVQLLRPAPRTKPFYALDPDFETRKKQLGSNLPIERPMPTTPGLPFPVPLPINPSSHPS